MAKFDYDTFELFELHLMKGVLFNFLKSKTFKLPDLLYRSVKRKKVFPLNDRSDRKYRLPLACLYFPLSFLYSFTIRYHHHNYQKIVFYRKIFFN